MRKALCVLTLLLIAACAPAAEEPESAMEPDTTEADMAAIDELRQAFADAVTAGDIDGIMAGYADDAVRMPPNEPAAVGIEAIRQHHEAGLEMYSYELANPAESIDVDGDLAVAHGTYTMTMTPVDDGEPMQDAGKYLVALERQADGSWKVTHEIWNSNSPPPEMM